MGHLYDVRENAIRHEVKKDDTLAAIAVKYQGKDDVPGDLDWKEIALYNWATVADAEVVRALCERVGSSVPDATVKLDTKPDTLALDPAFGPRAPELILVPKLWKKKGLAIKQRHTIKVLSPTPAPAIGITKLDKWFIPGHEDCDVDYRTLANAALADTVAFEVYGSNYVDLDQWNAGLPKFNPLPDEPVYTAAVDGGQIRKWQGLSKCAKGALKPDGRPLNVAFSPYTIALRHAKKDAHPTARIDLKPFWVAFDSGGKPAPESCKIEWEIKNANVTLGLLLIVDRAGTVVFAKGMNADDLGARAYEWNGKDAAGQPVVATKMPYRVQLQAHTGLDVADGIALAAMHTEVRLYVHKGTLPLDKDPYVPTDDKVSLDFSIADVYHKDKALDKDNDGSLWTKFKLAEAGFHPGPVAALGSDNDAKGPFKVAIREFQRSVPKGGGGGMGPFERLPTSGNETSDTKTALANLGPGRTRPWFGQPADPGDNITYAWRPGNWDSVTSDEFLKRLRDPSKRMIVWIDDRNWYTDGEYWFDGYYDGSPLVSRSNLDKIHAAPEDLGGASKQDGRGSFEDRDDRVGYDVRDIARPWIPLQVDFRLLAKEHELDSDVPVPAPDLAAKVRKAIGPLRVDWTFDEIEKASVVVGVKEDNNAINDALPELDLESDALLSLLYHPPAVRGTYPRPKGTRTRMALRWALDQLKVVHKRKDVNRKSVYYNAKETYGGIRPDDGDIGNYFKAALAHGPESLAPWTAAPDDDRQSICTAVHDRVGQGDDDVFARRLGRAGIYFHPSRIAGDGFQVRAQVRFDDKGPYICPNAAVLRKRYPLLPQAQSVQFRMWRKTTIRAYVLWAPSDDWSNPGPSNFDYQPTTGPDQWRAHYTACHVSIENELGVSNGALKTTPAALFPNPPDYPDLVVDSLNPGDVRADMANRNWISRSSDNAWPWSGDQHYGMPDPVSNRRFEVAKGALMTALNSMHVQIAIRMSLGIVKAIEAQTGRMRGHVLVQYQTTPDCYFQQYICDQCRESPVYVQNSSGTPMDNEPCPRPICLGTLKVAIKAWYKCPDNHQVAYAEAAPGGGAVGENCPRQGCTKRLSHHIANRAASASHKSKHGNKDVLGVPSPSCGFPIGVFWNFSGDASLWAHELGHNRHYEHSADAPSKPPKNTGRTEHDNVLNPFITNPDEEDDNKGWDRACLMSYVTQVTDGNGNDTYDKKRDLPCFCFKCVLRNRGWKVTPLVSPKGDLQDVQGV